LKKRLQTGFLKKIIFSIRGTIWEKRLKTAGLACLRWLLFAAEALCIGLAATVAVQWITGGTLPGVWYWCVKYPGNLLLTALLYAVAAAALGALTGRLWVSGALVGLAGTLLALVDYFKIAINGSPLQLADFGMIGQIRAVAGVAGSLIPPSDFWMALAALAFCVLLLALTRRLTALGPQLRFLTFSLSVLLAVVLLTPSGAQSFGERFGLDFSMRMDPAANHEHHGLTLSLWRDGFIQDKPPAEGYGEEYMREVLAKVDGLLLEDGGTAAPEESPNIIFILSESFFDPTRLPGIDYEWDPVENYHALEAEGVSGDFHSHYLGYGTGNVEISMLTGLRDTDLLPGTDMCSMYSEVYEYFDSLAEQYTKAGGYQAEMLHAFTDELYNRTTNYPLLGFENLLFYKDLLALECPWEPRVRDGAYMQDSYFCQALLERLNAINAEGRRAVLYGISMENHQPYTTEKFHNECQMSLTADSLTPEEQDVLRSMLEGIIRADQALGELTAALREVSEPTIVVFFGDHRPNLTLPDGETAYTKLGLCPGTWTYNWTPEQFNDLYSTDYLIWANDAALLGDQAGTRRDSSVTAIGPQLLELTGGPVSRYWGLMEKCAEVCLTRTSFYFVDGEGDPSVNLEESGLSPEALELLKLRDDVIYDAIYGERYITKAMNLPAGSPGESGTEVRTVTPNPYPAEVTAAAAAALREAGRLPEGLSMEDAVSRAMFIRLTAGALGAAPESEAVVPGETWYAPYVRAGYAMGLFDGSGEEMSFTPTDGFLMGNRGYADMDQPISRRDAAAIIARAAPAGADEFSPLLPSGEGNYGLSCGETVIYAWKLMTGGWPRPAAAEQAVLPLEEVLRRDRRIVHAGGRIAKADGGTRTYTNSAEALVNAYRAGNRVMEFDFVQTSDGHLAGIHDWISAVSPAITDGVPLSLEEWLQAEVYGEFTPLCLESLAGFMREHPDLYIVTDVKDHNAAAAAIIAESCPDLMDRFVIQIYKDSEYDEIAALGFRHIIYTLYDLPPAGQRDTAHFKEFAAEHPLLGYTYPGALRRFWRYTEKMKETGVMLFVHTINDEAEITACYSEGIDAVYTDNVGAQRFVITAE